MRTRGLHLACMWVLQAHDWQGKPSLVDRQFFVGFDGGEPAWTPDRTLAMRWETTTEALDCWRAHAALRSYTVTCERLTPFARTGRRPVAFGWAA